MKTDKTIERVTFKVTPERKQELKEFADKCGFNLSELIKVAVFEYMKNNK